VLLAAALAGATAAADGARGSEAGVRAVTVGCSQIIGAQATGHDDGMRVVLGIVSVPQAYLAGVVRAPQFAPFPYWRKAGMVVRTSNEPVTVIVPPAWRARVRIGWGNPAPEVAVVRFAACPAGERRWNAYAGGFFLRSRSACVPLTFEVGHRRSTVRFGVGRRC
jgi:hypothetical protein